MSSSDQSVEREFAIISLQKYLKDNPHLSRSLAVRYYEDFMDLAEDYKILSADFENLQAENIKLRCISNNPVPPSLPWFINKRN